MKGKRLYQILNNDNAKLRKKEAQNMAAELLMSREIDRTVTSGKVQELGRRVDAQEASITRLRKERNEALTRAYNAETAVGRAWDEKEELRITLAIRSVGVHTEAT